MESAEYDVDDLSSENNDDTDNSNEKSQHLTDPPEIISDLLSKITLSLPEAIANPNSALPNSNTSRIGNIFIDGSEIIDVGNKTDGETTVQGDVVMNEIVYNGNKIYTKPDDHSKFKQTASNETENYKQFRWKHEIYLITALIGATCLLYIVLSKFVINSPNVVSDGIVIVSRENWSPNPMAKPLQNLSLPVEIVVISHTMTKNGSNRWDCATIVRSERVQEPEFNFLVSEDGTIFEGSGWNKKGSHTNSFFNKRSIFFAFIGTCYYYPPSVRQVETVKKMIAMGVRLGKVMEKYFLSAACQLAFSRGLGAALNDETKNWPHYVGPINKSNLTHYHHRNYNQLQKRSKKRKKKTKSINECYKHSQ